MLAVCDNMKIVDVPEEGRRCFIFREAGPERKRRRNMRVRKSKKNVFKCKGEKYQLGKQIWLKVVFFIIKSPLDIYTTSATVTSVILLSRFHSNQVLHLPALIF